MAVRGRASVAVRQRDILKEEVRALREEQRELAREVIQISAYLWRTAPDHRVKAQAGRVIHLAQRIERRFPGGDAA